MSVQLVLYPQNYNGLPNAISNVTDEAVVNGINFSTMNSSSSYDVPSSVAIGAGTIANALFYQAPSIQNTWYRYRSTTSGTPTLPTQVNGNLRLYATTTSTKSGVYQQLSNLTVGVNYNAVVDMASAGVGTVEYYIFNGNTGATIRHQVSPSTASSFANFYAETTHDWLVISYEDTTASTFIVKQISVIENGNVVNPNNFTLEDGQVICDLYQEEDIPLTLSVDNFKNVAEKIQSYSKDFNLPATKRNNQIFNNIFEITRSADGIIFNPYLKTQCVLKQDGYILFEGYLRLIDVQDQQGEISYNVNLYSEVVALADVVKDRTFSDLDFTELEHDYNKTQIKYSWNDAGTGITYTNASTSGYRDAYNTVKYPFVDWTHQILLANGFTGNNATADYPELTSLQQVFRPFINIKYLIDRIFQDTPFNYSSDFFDTTNFNKLFMDFNWGSQADNNLTVGAGYYSASADNYAPNGSYGNLELTYPSGNLTQVDYDTSTNKITSVADGTTYNITYSYSIVILNVTPDPQYSARWLITRASGLTEEVNLVPIQTITANQTITYTGTLTVTLDNTETLEPEFYSNGTNVIVQDYDAISAQPLSTANVSITKSKLAATSSSLLQTLRGELGQWEFLKGIMTMFNLVSLPDKDNPLNIIIEPYSDVFINNTNGTTLSARGIQHDWTDKVDVSEMKLLPLTDLNKNTIFKFVEDDEDYAFNIYKKSVGGHLYGSKKFDASAFTMLEGEHEIIAEPFAATVPKPLAPQFPDFIVPAIFTSNEEATEFEGFDNSPRIMFNNGKKTLDASVTYYIPAQNGLSSENQPEFLQFSHLSTIPTASGTEDYHFGECQLINPIGNAVPDNLFNLYWLPYYAELYNANTRIMTLKVNLNAADINTFKFNDKVMIKNRIFRVNKIDYKPNALATVEFILIP